MRRKAAFGLVCLLTLGSSGYCEAQETAVPIQSGRTFHVDDTGTFVLDPALEMQWQPIGRSGASTIVTATTKVSVHLNLAPWVGQSGRIYMVLPRTTGPTVRASWTTGGTLLPGTLISGERALVYSGLVNIVVIRDLLDIKLEADGSRLTQPEALVFSFEIETDQ